MAVEVLQPTSPGEAAAAFGDGSGVTVVGGGTIVLPELTTRPLNAGRVLLLSKAGLDGITRAGGTVMIGSACRVASLEQGDEPLASAARHVGDPEIRAQATVGGNLCATYGEEAPRGDLQGPLLALGARVSSTGADGERTEPLEDFLAAPAGRLVLAVSYDDGNRSVGYAATRRPHAHHYTILAVSAVNDAGGTRVAVIGAAPQGRRCHAVEAAVASGAAGAEAAEQVLADVEQTLRDDALASAWYRRRVLPGLVAKALAQLA
jgi:CO/xanthine dehydrogenase FAD-binding subunit